MPLPLNQNTKRGCTAASAPVAAYAVPFELNMAASGGRPTLIAAPVMLMFLRNRRLLSGMMISCFIHACRGGPACPPRADTRVGPYLRRRQSIDELRRLYQGHNH